MFEGSIISVTIFSQVCETVKSPEVPQLQPREDVSKEALVAWGWVKTLVPFCSQQNELVVMDVHPFRIYGKL